MGTYFKSMPENMDEIINEYGNILFRICLIMLGNSSDAEDAVQETMIKYMHRNQMFENKEHEKAWLIKVATNKCRDMLRFRTKHLMVDLQDVIAFVKDSSDNGIIDSLMTLPDKFRIVLVLYYVEGYNTEEIAKIIGKSKSAVKMRLQKGRTLLREVYRKEYP